VSNRQERRAAKAIARKVAKGREGLPKRILDQVGAWMAEEDIDLEAMGIDDPRFDEALDGLSDELNDLLGDDFLTFRTALNDMAMTAEHPVVTSDGSHLVAVSQLFFVPVHGPEHAVHNMLGEDEAFSWFVKSFRQYGVAHDVSSVRLLRGSLTAEAAASATPGVIRKVAMGMLRLTADAAGANNASDEVDRDILALAGGDYVKGTMEVSGAVTIVDRLLVGARTIIVDPSLDPENEPTDYLTHFMSPEAAEILMSDDGEDLSEDVGDFMGEEVSRWFEVVHERFGTTGVLVDLPEAWGTSVSRLGRNRLAGAIDIEKVMLGIEHDAVADKIHIHYGEDHALVALQFGDRLVGPVDIHKALIAPDPDGFSDDIAEFAREIEHHPSKDTLLALSGGTSPAGRVH